MRIATLTLTVLLSGCAAPAPEWLAEKHSGFCIDGVEPKCLTMYGLETFERIEPSSDTTADLSALAFGLASLRVESVGKDATTLPEQVQAFAKAGAVIGRAHEDGHESALAQLASLGNEDAKAYGISRLLTIHAGAMKESEINESLNLLHRLDHDHYQTGLSVKLAALLARGDYERAEVLRRELLTGPSDNPSRPFSMLALVMASYSLAGLSDDAWGIARKAFHAGMEMGADDRKLLEVAIESAKGNYPPPQFFYDFSSDETRLQAYLTVATLAYRLKRPELAELALSDAVRFTQKSSTRVNRAIALGHILYLSVAITPKNNPQIR